MIVGHQGLRVRAARLAAAATALKRLSGAAAPFSLAFMTDRRRIEDPEPVMRALPAGAAVIYRGYDDPKREATARRFLAICRARGVFFLVAGDAALAAQLGADGAHWPAWAFENREPGSGIRETGGPALKKVLPRLSGPRLPDPGSRFPLPAIITVACHDADDLARAARIGADLALLSPAFPTRSHPGAEHLGPARFRALAAASPLPVLALGGVNEENAALLAAKNVAGIAAIGAFLP
jgi:thiamine-phosphate pyrophosphorylase